MTKNGQNKAIKIIKVTDACVFLSIKEGSWSEGDRVMQLNLLKVCLMINRQQTIKDYNRKDNGRKIDEQLILTKSPLL